jgi:CheY-like chemotaxis protein
MPRLDGYAVARLVKQRWPYIRVIVLTSSELDEDRLRAEEPDLCLAADRRRKENVRFGGSAEDL